LVMPGASRWLEAEVANGSATNAAATSDATTPIRRNGSLPALMKFLLD
jgi:hypothetical protein